MAKRDFIAAEVIPLIQRENGATIASWEVCYLLNNELAAMAGAPLDRGVFYYGDVVIQGIDPFLGFVSFQNSAALAGDVNTLYTNNISGSTTPQNIFRNVLWNQVANWSDVHGHFYGYKLNRARGWVAQTPNYSLSTGWSLASGVYTHSSGTNELGISGAWLLGSPSLRMTITFTGITAGSLSVELDSSGPIGTIDADGTRTFSFTPDALDSAINLIPTSNFNGSFAESSVIIEKYDYI